MQLHRGRKIVTGYIRFSFFISSGGATPLSRKEKHSNKQSKTEEKCQAERGQSRITDDDRRKFLANTKKTQVRHLCSFPQAVALVKIALMSRSTSRKVAPPISSHPIIDTSCPFLSGLNFAVVCRHRTPPCFCFALCLFEDGEMPLLGLQRLFGMSRTSIGTVLLTIDNILPTFRWDFSA